MFEANLSESLLFETNVLKQKAAETSVFKENSQEQMARFDGFAFGIRGYIARFLEGVTSMKGEFFEEEDAIGHK